jgi:RNA polymerase sigma factor (sigma-70 family)
MRTEDSYIISRCLNGESEAFGLLVDKYKAGIYAFTYAKLRNFHDAEDVTQEVFIKAYRNLKNLKRWDSFLKWLYSIAFNLCADWVRAQSRRPDNEFIADQDPRVVKEALETPPVDNYHENIIIDLLHEALDSLPEAYREVLTLYYLGGLNSEEIAKSLSISPTSIRQQLSRARSELKEEIIVMMSATYREHKLPSTFTFRIVEAIKRINIHPNQTMKGLPWGLSLVTGIIITVLSLNPQLNSVIMLGSFGGSLLPSESKVLKVGEIPVDITKVSRLSFISSQKGNGNSNEPYSKQNALFMAPKANVGEWVRKADMPTARAQLGGAVVNGKIYAIGGINANFIQLSTVEEYDPIDNKWTEKANMPVKRCENGAVVIDGLIYVVGGFDGIEIIPSVYVYDPSKDKWTKKTDMLTPRANPYVGVVNGRIYTIAGLAGKNPDFKLVSTVEEYDPIKDIWTKKADMPIANGYFDGAVVNNKIYIFGGDSSNIVVGWGPALPDVYEYDPATDIWTRKSDIPTPRIVLSAVTVNSKIYAIGGHNGVTVNPIVEIYDPSNDTWSKGENLLVPTSAPISCAVNGKIYVIGGSDGNQRLSDVQEYDTGFKPSQNVELKGKLSTTWGSKKK